MLQKTTYLILVLNMYVFSQNTVIPDANFEQALIDLGLDTAPINGVVPTTNIASVTNLNIESKNINNLTGIEDFSSLMVLECANNNISSITTSANLNLTQLFVNNNALTNIDVSNNSLLQILWCDNNQLSSLNVSQNPNLISIACSNNNITTLNVSNNIKLNVLVCDNNQLNTLNITNNTTLNRLQCAGNLLTSLNVSLNTDLAFLYCNNNQIDSLSLNSRLIEINCSFNNLTVLNVSENNRLTQLNASYNNLCSLNVNNGNNNNFTLVDFSENNNLNCVIVDNPNGNHSTWNPVDFSNYVNSENACEDLILVDKLPDVVGPSYTLPILTNGNYFTEANGNGNALFAGQVINNSQTIFIYNNTACYSNQSSFYVLITNASFYIPKYFTPNNDNTHDTWKVIDNSGTFLSINIYNRYGKLLKTLQPNNLEWDGTYNGNVLISDDYWYVINRLNNKPIKGHFTLKK